MSRCSKKCNEIKQKIDSISGLDDDYIYDFLITIEFFVDTAIKDIAIYLKENKLNGTCFRKEVENEQNNNT